MNVIILIVVLTVTTTLAGRDFYNILNVPRSASLHEIKKVIDV